jgi:hypothetical protein
MEKKMKQWRGKMKKILLGLCLLSLVLIVGCSSERINFDETPCNEETSGTSVKDGCNTCTCTEYDGNYGWTCTEIGCGPFEIT